MAEPVAAPEAGEGEGGTARRLRRFAIAPGMQLRLAAWPVAVAAAVAGLLGWRLWAAYREASLLVELGDPASDEAMARLLLAEDQARMAWLGAALAGVLLGLLGLSLVATHRVAGPAAALARDCRALARRLQVPRPHRRTDLLGGLAAELRGAVEGLRAREEAERLALLEAAALLGTGPEGEARARAILERLAAEKAERLGP